MQGAKWGVVVIMLALVGAVIGSYVMSMDVIENEVTKYSPLADMTGEFDVEKTPEYVEYNPSTNYTGYYTDASVIGNERYFDGVEYVSSNPNNFRLNLAPASSESDNYDVSGVSLADVPGMNVAVRFVDYVEDEDTDYVAECKGTTLRTMISDLSLTDADVIRFSAVNSLSDVDLTGSDENNPVQSDWVFFFPYEWAYFAIIGAVVWVSDSATYSELHNSDSNLAHVLNLACMSCIYDQRSGTVSLYYDNNFNDVVGIYSADSMYVAYSHRAGGDNTNEFRLGDTVDATVQMYPPFEYLDPSKGVELE